MFKSPATNWWSRGGQKDPRKVVLPAPNTRYVIDEDGSIGGMFIVG